MRAIAFDRTALKELSELPAKQYRQVVGAVLDLLKEPQPHYAKSLAGSEYLRLTIGEYRVVYRFDDACVTIVAFGKRNDDEIYRALKRKN